MKVRYLADADFNQKVVNATLRIAPGVDFALPREVGISDRTPDPQVLDIAARAGRILVTHDKATMPGHFAEFIQSRESPGVFVVPRGYGFIEIAGELALIWEASDAAEWVNRIIYIPM
jgi:hypothetical protein